MIRRGPIRTYGRKKTEGPVQTICQSICRNVDEGGAGKPAIDSDNSLREDPFETTFDRIARNARMPAQVETGDERSWLSSSYDSVKEKSLSRLSDNLVETVPRYPSKKMRVVGGRLTKSGRRLRIRDKTLEKSTNVSFKIPPKTRRKRQRAPGRAAKKKQSKKTGSLSSVRTDGNCSIDISVVRNEEDKTNIAPVSKVTDSLAGLTEAQKLLGVKSCSIVLNKLPVEGYEQDRRVGLRNSRRRPEKGRESRREKSAERSISLRECSILVERLTVSPFSKSRIKKLISSTPIGGKFRISSAQIPVSPIQLNLPNGYLSEPVDCSDDKSAICPVYKDTSTELLSASYTFDRRSNRTKLDKSPVGKSSEVYSDNTERLETTYDLCPRKSNYHGASVNISVHRNSTVLDGRGEQERFRHRIPKEEPHECLDSVGESVQLVQSNYERDVELPVRKQQRSQSTNRTESPDRTKSQDETNPKRRTRLLRSNSSSNSSRKTEADDGGKVEMVAKQKQTNLHFSIDSDRSRSLFDNTSLPVPDTTERSNSVFLLEDSNATGTTQSVLSLKGFSDSEVALVKVKLEERLKTLAPDGELNELNGYSTRRSSKRNSEVRKEESSRSVDSVEAIDSVEERAEPCVLLRRLQDPSRVTNRRKRYGKWDMELTDVLEDSVPESVGENAENVPKRLRSLDRSNLAFGVNGQSSVSDTRTERNLFLKPGKSWARSLSILNGIKVKSDLDQMSVGKGKKWRHSVVDILNMQKQGVIQSCVKGGDERCPGRTEGLVQTTGFNGNVYRCSSINRPSRRISIRVVPNKKSLIAVEDAPFLEAYGIEPERSLDLALSPRRSSVYDIRASKLQSAVQPRLTAREVVLQRCGQDDCLPFQECFTDPYLDHCRKIGEGVYGEVFLHEVQNDRSVIKVIPIEGAELVNGEPQKKFDEILSEIVIAKELHNLRYNSEHNTDSFVEVKRIRCLFGEYPSRLVELWRAYDEERTSDNDCPVTFGQDQLYIVLELGHGGQDLEAFVFNSAEEALAVFVQTALALAVAEKAVEFEHRDLHWGNVLISRTEDSYVRYTLEGEEIRVPSHGVKASIIDFTLSRMSYQGCYIFNDLALDPALFTAQGEYQFEVYRLMRDKVENDWQKFEPYTNVLWLHYTLDKMLTAVRYRKKTGRAHRAGLARLSELKAQVLAYESSFEFASNSEIVEGMRCTGRRTRNSRARLLEDPRASVVVVT